MSFRLKLYTCLAQLIYHGLKLYTYLLNASINKYIKQFI